MKDGSGVKKFVFALFLMGATAGFFVIQSENQGQSPDLAKLRKEKVERKISPKDHSRFPASVPATDPLASNQRLQVETPRKPAQARELNRDQLVSEFKHSELKINGQKYRLIEDLVVVSQKKAIDWGVPVRSTLMNQAVIEREDLPKGERFTHLVFSEKTKRYVVLTNNLVIKFKNAHSFNQFIEDRTKHKILSEFPPVRLVIVEGEDQQHSQALFEELSKNPEVERVHIEIIEQSKSPR